jgi:hypothetical protein
MGSEGGSKRKPEKSRPFSNAEIRGSSNDRSPERPLVHSLVKDKGVPLNRGDMYPPPGSDRNHNKGS